MENTKNKGPIIASLINLLIGLLILTSIGMIIGGSYSLYENFKGITKINDVMDDFFQNILSDQKIAKTLKIDPSKLDPKNGMGPIFEAIDKITTTNIDDVIKHHSNTTPTLNTIKELKKIIQNLTAATASDIMSNVKNGGIKAIT